MTPAPSVIRSIGGFDILETRTEALIETLRERRFNLRPTELLFANTNFIVSCHAIAPSLRGPETIVVNDGIGLDLASRMLFGRAFIENMNGTDFTPRLLESVGQPTRLFLLGARPASIAAAAAAWSALPDIEILGAIDGYAGMSDPEAVIHRIRDARPDVLLLALGDPRQAEWIVRERGRHGVPLVIAVGALFDFVSGEMQRAPLFVRRLRCEWLYRLAMEPRRLLKRYSVDLVIFFAHVLRMHRRAGRDVVSS